MKRPVSVTVIAVLILTGAVFGLILLFVISPEEITKNAQAISTLSFKTLFWSNLLNNTVNVAIGIGLLYGKNWARKMLIYFSPVFIMISYFVVIKHILLLFSVVIYVVYVYFLNRKNTVAYFEGSLLPEDVVMSKNIDGSNKIGTLRKIFAIIFLIVGGYMFFTTMFLTSIHVDKISIKIIMVGLFFVISMLAFIPGVFLWGIKRWKKSTATVLISSSGLLLFGDVSLYLFFHSSYSKQVPKINTAIFNGQTLINSIIIGSVVLAVGIIMLVYGKKKGDENKPMVDISPS